MPLEAEAEFSADVSSPQEARSFVVDQLEAWGLTDVADIAEVLVNEMATTAVIHDGTSAAVRVVRLRGNVRVEAPDGSTAPVRVQRYEPGATSGRGLMIVDA